METKTQLAHTNVTVSPTPVGRVPRAYVAALSAWGGLVEYGVFSPSFDNAMTSLMERVFYHKSAEGFAPPSVPTVASVYGKLNGVLTALKDGCRLSAPVSILEFPGLYYTGPKKQLYERAAQTVFRRGFQLRDAKLKSFVKIEKVEIKEKRLVPRLIQPRSPEYNVLVGRYIKHLEHSVYSQLNGLWGGPTIMKGLNCFQQAHAFREAWTSFHHPVAIMLDAVRFDQHVSSPMLQWEHEVYLAHYRGRDREELAMLLKQQLVNRGSIRTDVGTIKYTVAGCRMSGDMNTALGNCLIMSSCCLALVQSVAVRARLFNNGDDCCLIVESADEPKLYPVIKPFFSELGFIIEVEESTNIFEKISFCQTSPLYDGVQWRMSRDPRKVLSKDTTLTKRWSEVEWHAYWVSLGKCGLALTSGLPIFQEFYSAMVRFGSGKQASQRLIDHVNGSLRQTGMYQLAKGLRGRVRPVTEAARASFHLAFGVPPAAQQHFEAYYRHIGAVPPTLFREPRFIQHI